MSLDDIFKDLHKQFPDEKSSHQQELEEEEKLLKDLADRWKVKFVDLNEYEVTTEIVNLLPLKTLKKYESFPFHETETEIYVVFSDISDINAVSDIELCLNKEVVQCIARKDQIKDILREHAGIGLDVVDKMLDDIYDNLT